MASSREGRRASATAKHAAKVDWRGRYAIDLQGGGSILWRNVLARCDLELSGSACRAKRPITVCSLPKRERNRHRINIDPAPPCRLIAVPVKLAMMEATNRDRELVADLAAQRPRLRKAKMMRI
jgi:hypothetical protein